MIMAEKKVWYIASFKNVCGKRRHVLSLFNFSDFIKEDLIKKNILTCCRYFNYSLTESVAILCYGNGNRNFI